MHLTYFFSLMGYFTSDLCLNLENKNLVENPSGENAQWLKHVLLLQGLEFGSQQPCQAVHSLHLQTWETCTTPVLTDTHLHTKLKGIKVRL